MSASSSTPSKTPNKTSPKAAPTTPSAAQQTGPFGEMAAALLAAVIASGLVALLEWRRVSPEVNASQATWSGIASAFGLVVPFALLLALVVAVFCRVVRVPLGAGFSSLRDLDEAPSMRGTRVAALALTSLPTLLVWLVLSAAVFVRALSGSLDVALGSLIVSLALCAALALSRSLAVALTPRLPASIKPSRWIVLALLGGLLAIVLLVVAGEPSGAGGTKALFGVMKRDELDLSGPWELLLLAACAYQGPRYLRRVPPIASALAVILALLVTWGAGSWLEEPSLALAVERRAPLGNWSLKLLRVASDRDHDGFASRYGGGDCDDRDARVNPDADDQPGNGIDEDCSGADEPVEASDVSAPVAATSAPSASGSGATPASAGSVGATPGVPNGVPTSGMKLPANLNVVFISIDTVRHDIGFVGYPRKITPNIDAFAARSTYFDHAYSLASYTSKSIGPLFVGRYGSETHHGELHFSVYPPIDKMLQERLSPQGIQTLSIQAHWYFKPNTGLGRGFDILDMSAAPAEKQGEGDRTVSSEHLSDAAIRHLNELSGNNGRFFMWVHYLDPHAEYVAHEGFDFGSDPRALYDGEVAFSDHHVGRVLDAIAKSPFADRTAIIVTSDHGETFGEHGMTRHGFELWDVLVRVPLAIYIPGVAPHIVSQRRSAIDLNPTILELFGVPLPAAGGDDFLSGTSLLPDVMLPEGYVPGPRPIFIDMPGGPFVPERQAFIENDLKLITSRLRPMGLYDLAHDPDENENLMKDTARTGAALERMKAFRRKLHRAD